MKHTKNYMDAMWVVENPEKYDNRDVARANSFIQAYNEGYSQALSLGAASKSLPVKGKDITMNDMDKIASRIAREEGC